MSSVTPRHIWFLFSDTGGGHRSAAEAIIAASEECWPGSVRVTLFDFLAACAPWPLNRGGKFYSLLINRVPGLYASAYGLTEGRRRTDALYRLANAMYSHRLVSALRAGAPDIIVSVHPLANHIAVAAATELAQGMVAARRIPVVTVVTDLVAPHPSWFCPAVDRWIVPTQSAADRGLRYGMPVNKMRLAGLPVHSKFKAAGVGRLALGLDPDRFTLLLIGGGEGLDLIYNLARAVAGAGLPIQLVIVAGRNARLRERLERVDWEVPTLVRGFVTNMPDWMHAADVVITKAGPGTISEAAVVGLPILLYGFVPGQETANVRFVVESGAGLFVKTPQQLVVAVRDLVEPDSPSLHRMREASRGIGRPDAAEQIAVAIRSLIFP